MDLLSSLILPTIREIVGKKYSANVITNGDKITVNILKGKKMKTFVNYQDCIHTLEAEIRRYFAN